MPEPTSVRPSFVRCDVCGELTASRAVGARGYARHRKCVKHGERATYDRGCRCQECRDAKTALMREYVRMVKERDGRSPTQKYRPARGRVCDWCGRALTSAAGTAADGLMLCKPHRDEKRDRDRRNASRRRAFQRKIDNAAAGVPANPRWPFVQGVCRYCKESFVRRGQASPYCSSKCRRKDGPRKWITASARRSIYERDHWMCQLCFEPVDKAASHLDDWAPTLDHIEPRATALIPDHTPENLRTAHRWCNSVRGDGTINMDFFEAA